MQKWQSIPTLGFTKAVSLILMTSVITMGSSIASQIPVASPTSKKVLRAKAENQKEEREGHKRIKLEAVLRVLTNLNKTLEEMARILSKEKSSPSTQQSEEQIMKRQDNSFVNDVLTKKLTDGTPAYYNSNILGRYYRKDYFDD